MLVGQQLYNHRIDIDTAQTFGKIIIEGDSSYISFGNEFQQEKPFNFGVFALEFDKLNGKIESFTISDIDSTAILFNLSNKAISIDENIFFLSKESERTFINEYSSISKTLNIIDTLSPSINVVSSFIGDFHGVDNILYIYVILTLEDNSLEICIYKYDLLSKEYDENIFYTSNIDEQAGKICVDEGDIFIFSNDSERRLVIDQIDQSGILSNLYTSTENRFSTIRALHKVNSKEYIFTNSNRMFINGEFHHIPTIIKFDIDAKQIVWEKLIYANEYWKNNIAFPNVISSIEGDGFITSGRISKPFYSEDSLITVGVVAKMNLDGNWAWRKEFYYLSKEGDSNEFNDIIKTSDDKYLCYGSSIHFDLPSDEDYWSQGWVVKLNADGTIVEDTSTAIDVLNEYENVYQIEILSNIVQDEIIVNQKNIRNVRYYIFDVSGRLIDQFYLDNSNQTYYYNMYAYPPGLYFISANSGLNKIFSGKIVKY